MQGFASIQSYIRFSVGSIFAVTLALLPASTLEAQQFPAFANPATNNTSTPVLRGVSLVTFQTSYGAVNLAFYADATNGRLAYANQTGPNTFSGSYYAENGASPELYYYPDQNANTGNSSAGVTAIVSNGNMYVAYVENNSNQFVVLQAQAIPQSNNNFFFNEVYRDTTSGAVNTAPASVNFAGNTIFIYGTSRNSNINNEAWTTWIDASGNWHTQDANFSTPTQPGVANFNGTLYYVQKQNNSNNGIFFGRLDSTGHFISASQLNSNWRTPSGLTMLVWNSQLLFAAQANASPYPLCVYTSPNASNWSSNCYSGINIDSTPGLAIFGGSLNAAGKTAGSSSLTATSSTP